MERSFYFACVGRLIPIFIMALNLSCVRGNPGSKICSLSKDKKIQFEESMGIKYPARQKNRAVIFNGDFELGTAGFAIKRLLPPEKAFRKDIPGLSTIKRIFGKGYCLRIKSVEGSPKFVLLGREVYIPEKMNLIFSFEGRVVNGESCRLTLDFRTVIPGRIRDPRKKYRISGGSFTLQKDWMSFKKEIKITKPGYYRYCIYTKFYKENQSIPEVWLDSISLYEKDGMFGNKKFPQVAIYTNKNIPFYYKNEKIVYKVLGFFPNCEKTSQPLTLVFYNEQTMRIIFTKQILLNKKRGKIFEGETSFTSPVWGPLGMLVKREGQPIDSFGGEFVVGHKLRKHTRDEIGFRLFVCLHDFFDRARGEPLGDKRIFWNVMPSHSDTIDDMFKLMKFTGMQGTLTRIAWNKIEPEEGKWDFSLIDKIMELYKKNNMRISALYGSKLCLNRRTGKPLALPDWIIKYSKPHRICKFHPWKAYLPPLKFWERYCKKVSKRYHQRLIAAEIFGEPKGWCTPEEYITYLSSAYKAIKSVTPNINVIGPCPTGDGDAPRFIEWARSILALGGEKYLDGFSYHPYGASNDFQVGNYFQATETIKKLRSLIKNPKIGLWDTECFQHPNMKYKRCDRWDASTGLRHILIGLGNDVKLVAPHALYELKKDRLNPHIRIITPWIYEKIPAPITAATNFLSFILGTTNKATVLDVNNFSRTYLFSDKTQDYAVGVLWYLRPEGAFWTRKPEFKNINMYDMFGNPLASNSLKLKIGYNPVYITGHINEVKKCLQSSTIVPNGDIIKIKGRIAGDMLILDGENLLGKPENIFLKIPFLRGALFPEYCNFMFQKNRYDSIIIPGIHNISTYTKKILPCKVFINSKFFKDTKIKILPKTDFYRLSSHTPLKINLGVCSNTSIYGTDKGLLFEINVKDKEIIPPDKHLWEGDSVEIFIDPMPIQGFSDPYAGVTQFVFSAKPSRTGDMLWTNKKLLLPPVSKIKTAGNGYMLHIIIPWEDILTDIGPMPVSILGINIYINNFSASGKCRVEKLSHPPFEVSRKNRFYYPLFELPESLKQSLIKKYYKLFGISTIKNSDFSVKGKNNKPKYWNLSPKKLCFYGNFGPGNKSGIKITAPPNSSSLMPIISQKVMCKASQFSGKTVVIESMMKFKGNPRDLCFIICFYKNTQHRAFACYGYGKNLIPLPSEFGWSILQIASQIPPSADYFCVYIGLKRHSTPGTTLSIGQVNMKIVSGISE